MQFQIELHLVCQRVAGRRRSGDLDVALINAAVIVDVGQQVQAARPQSVEQGVLNQVDRLLAGVVKLAMELSQRERSELVDELPALLQLRANEREAVVEHLIVNRLLNITENSAEAIDHHAHVIKQIDDAELPADVRGRERDRTGNVRQVGDGQLNVAEEARRGREVNR